MPDDLKISTTPQIRRLDIVIRISVESLVRQREFVELMDPQKNGTKLSRVFHEGIECDIFTIRSKTQRVIGAVGRSVRAIRTLPPKLTRGGDGSSKILDSRTNPPGVIGETASGSENGGTANYGLFHFGQFQPKDVSTETD